MVMMMMVLIIIERRKGITMKWHLFPLNCLSKICFTANRIEPLHSHRYIL